ncbi:MAG: hypothetical protein OXR67_09490 [Chloroflexota bacterium]|nr:hypothetical protein [Chloroflexota bacterium]
MFVSASPPTPQQSLADIVREETDDGRLIVRFLVDVMQGGLEAARPCHRLDAARQLLNLGFDSARAFISDIAPATRTPRRRTLASSPQLAAPSPRHQELFDLVWEETDHGRSAVRFLVDVMLGNLHDFKPHHRLFAAKELLRRGFDQPASSPEAEAQSEADSEEEDIERCRAEDPDGIYYRGRDYKWYRDELRSPPHPNRSGSNGLEARDLSAPPPDLDGGDRCPASCGPLDFPASSDDDHHGISCLSQPCDYTHVCDPFCLHSQPASQSTSQDFGEDAGEDVERDDDRSPLDDSVEGISRERPPPRPAVARISLDRPVPLDSLTVGEL